MKKRLPLIKKQIQSNWAYKLVALVVAIIIWSTILWGNKDAVLVKNYKIEFITAPGYRATHLFSDKIEVRATGARSQLRRLAQGLDQISINVQGLSSGRREIEIHPYLLDLPMGVRLVSISPRAVTVDIRETRNNNDD